MLFLFAVSITIHIFYCRRAAQKRLHIKAYVRILFILLSVYVLGVLALHHGEWLKEHPLLNMPFKITSGIILMLFGPFYLIFYGLTHLVSPSQKILLSVAQNGGASYADIVMYVQEEDFIGTRLRDLCASGCVVQEQGRYMLSPSGRKLATTLEWMQRMTGRGMGG